MPQVCVPVEPVVMESTLLSKTLQKDLVSNQKRILFFITMTKLILSFSRQKAKTYKETLSIGLEKKIKSFSNVKNELKPRFK
jgi:hypothetical protein